MNQDIESTITYVKIYNAILLVLYICVLSVVVFLPFMIFSIIKLDDSAKVNSELNTLDLVFGIGFAAFFSLILIALHGLALYFLKKKTKFVWILQIIVLSLGFMSILTLPFAIILLIRWTKDDVKSYFNQSN